MSDLSTLRINPALDPAPFAEIYRRDGVVQIPVFLEPVDAEAVAGRMDGLTWSVDGQIERGFMPGFNVLTLFRVPKAHSVAPVAAYAAAKRLSLTGWLVREPAALV